MEATVNSIRISMSICKPKHVICCFSIADHSGSTKFQFFFGTSRQCCGYHLRGPLWPNADRLSQPQPRYRLPRPPLPLVPLPRGQLPLSSALFCRRSGCPSSQPGVFTCQPCFFLFGTGSNGCVMTASGLLLLKLLSVKPPEEQEALSEPPSASPSPALRMA